MAPHSSTLAWKIPWTEEPGRLQSMGSRLSDFPFTFHFHALEKEMATHSSVLAWRIPGTGKPGGLPSMGSHRVRHDWSNLAAAADGHWEAEEGYWRVGGSKRPGCVSLFQVKSLEVAKCPLITPLLGLPDFWPLITWPPPWTSLAPGIWIIYCLY